MAVAGKLRPRNPFARSLAPPAELPSTETVDAFPSFVLPKLKKALEARATGLLAFGSSVIEDHPAIELVAATLPVTQSLGPVARIKARNRGTPAKDMMVPDAIKALPILPSVQSAYEHGFRRMIVQPSYTDVELMLEYADDVLLILGTYGFESTDIYFNACRSGGFRKSEELLAKVVAVVGVSYIDAKGGAVRVSDMYVPPNGLPVPSEFGEMDDHIADNRVLRWEGELLTLLDSKRVSVAAVRKALSRNSRLNDVLAGWSKTKAARSVTN